jgi:hypothetical protein
LILPPTIADEAKDALAVLIPRMQATLGDNLLGIYLYGSAVWGDFDEGISDLDLLAVVRSEIVDADLPALHSLHDGFVADSPQWADRIEVQYFTPAGLANFRDRASPMANISPGEPLHIIEAGAEWLSNWYFVQDYGITLAGPSPDHFIPAIAPEEFLSVVRDYAEDWIKRIPETRDSLPAQGYAIMTMSRALYTLVHNEQVSKRKAAAWVGEVYPEETNILADAFAWRANYRRRLPSANFFYPRTEAFVQRMWARMPVQSAWR